MISTDRVWGEALVRFGPDAGSENSLDADQVEHCRRLLLGSLDEIVERIAAAKAVRRVRDGAAGDCVDVLLADRVAAHRTEIESVSGALVAIDAGVYGICLSCRRSIGFEALSGQPATRLCAACSERAATSSRGPVEEGSR